MVEILNSKTVTQYIPQWQVDDKKLALAVEEVLPQKIRGGKINVIFSTLSEIKRLNLEYRNIDNATDVLSFGYEEKEFMGEIYVCPEYISQAYTGRDGVVEVLRCIVHGALHVAGEEHKGTFDGKASEPMFEKQEAMLNSIIGQLNI
jgi:probable rRNA maturation factor